MKITDINANKEHRVSEVVCLNCKRRWISVRPTETLLKNLECPKCGLVGFAIETGESLEQEDT